MNGRLIVRVRCWGNWISYTADQKAFIGFQVPDVEELSLESASFPVVTEKY